MYGFRKVADCSDRTYSHPFFRRNQPHLLSEVRRVVSMTAAAAAAAAAAANLNASEIASNNISGHKRSAPATQEDEDEYGSHTTGESEGDNKNGDGSSPPTRKKIRGCVGAVPPSAAAAAAAAAATAARLPVVNLQHLNTSGGAKGHPGYGAAMGSKIIDGGVFSHPLSFGGTAPLPGPTSAHKLRLQAAAAANAFVNANPGSVKPEFTSPWHQHSGLWGGVSNSLEDPWTSGSGSGSRSSSAASSVEASSPVLLPINPADLDCSSNIPPFYLQTESPPPPPPHLQQQQQQQPASAGGVHHTDPALVSPAGSSAVAESASFGGAADWRGGGGAAAAAAPGAAYPSFARSVSPAEQEEEVAAVAAATTAVYSRGLYSDAWSLDDVGAGGGAGSFVAGRGKLEDSSLSLDKAFGFGAALARCPSFDLTIDSDDLAVDVPVSPTEVDQVVAGAGAASEESFVANVDKNTISDSNSNNDGGSTNAAIPVPPSSPVDLNTVAAAAASAAASAAATASAGPFGPREAATIINRSVGWDLAALGGAGWGSPETHDSTAAEPWAALPPLGSTLSRVSSTAHSFAASSVGCVSSTSLSSEVWKRSWGAFTVAKHSSSMSCSGGSGEVGAGEGGAAAVVVEGGGYGAPSVVIAGAQRKQQQEHHHQQQEQQQARLHNRTLSTLSTFSLPTAAADADSLDWALLTEDNTDAAPTMMGGGFDDDAAFSGMVVGSVGGSGGIPCRT
eukprot:jgi/Undpi1/10804/HiC_scaffold_3.g01333.m1